MKKVLLVFLAILLAPISSFAATPIEQGATIDSYKEQGISPEQMALYVLNYGYLCNSISSVRTMGFSNDFILTCNNSANEYKIKKIGGSWVATPTREMQK